MVLNLIIANGIIIDLKELQSFQNGSAIEKGIQKLFTYKNPQYAEALRWGRSTWNIPRNLYSWEYGEDNNSMFISRGGLDKLKGYLTNFKISLNFIDNTQITPPVSFDHSKTILRPDQTAALNDMMTNTNGCLIAYTAFGKTLTLLELVRKLRQPAVIIVHTTFLQEQWIKEATNPDTFNMSRDEIGGVGGIFKKRRYGKLNVCLYHSLTNPEHLEFFSHRIGTVIFDEGQKSPIDGVQKVVNVFPARYKYTASANIKRKDGKEFLTLDTFGKVLHVAVEKDGTSKVLCTIDIFPTDYTDLQYNEDKNYSNLLSRMGSDKERNILICKVAISKIRNNKLVIIFVERKEQAGYLMKMLSAFKGDMLLGGVNTETTDELDCSQSVKEVLKSYDHEGAYERISKLAEKKELQFIIGTQKAEVGLSIRTIDVGIVTTPVGNNLERFNQIKGRVERTYSEEQEAYFGHKKPRPELIVLKDKVKPSREAASKIKDIYGSAVSEIRRAKRSNETNIIIRKLNRRKDG